MRTLSGCFSSESQIEVFNPTFITRIILFLLLLNIKKRHQRLICEVLCKLFVINNFFYIINELTKYKLVHRALEDTG